MHRPTRRTASIFSAVAILSLLAFVFIWRPVLAAIWHGWNISDIAMLLVPNDQMTYVAIVTNVAHGHPAYVEPFTGTGHSIYPSGYYWFEGMIARLTGTGPLAVWNVVGAIFFFGLMSSIGFLAATLTKRTWAWLVGPSTIFIGTLEWWLSGSFMAAFHHRAVAWPPAAILLNPNAEMAALFPAFLAVGLLVRAMQPDGSIRLREATACGVLIGLGLNMHTYVSMFTIGIVAATLLFSQISVSGRRACSYALGIVVLGVFCATIVPTTNNLLRLVIVLLALTLPLAINITWLRRSWRAVTCIWGPALLVAVPVFLKIAADLRSPDSFTKLRQNVTAGPDFGIPVASAVLRTSPSLLVLVFVFIVLSRRRSSDPTSNRWLALLVSSLFVSALFSFNWLWNFDQEPYRFFPYAILFITATTLPWLFTIKRQSLEISLGIVSVIALVATLPTSYMGFEARKNTTIYISPQERAAYDSIAKMTPKQGLVLTDHCLPRKLFKIATGKMTLDYNAGLANPSNLKDSFDIRIADISQDRLPGDDTLGAAGVTSYVTMSYCSGPTPEQLSKRFGPPIAVVPFSGASACGFPDDAKISAYRVGGGDGKNLTYVGYNHDKRNFLSDEAAVARHHCGYNGA